MVRAVDEVDYYRIPADTRNLNYNKYFTEGQSKVSLVDEYNSYNTKQLNVEETKQLLLKLRSVKMDIKNERIEKAYEP
jgi:UDP-glucose 4-epimerase